MTSNRSMMFVPLLTFHPVEYMIRYGSLTAFNIEPDEVLFIVPRRGQKGEFILAVQINRRGDGYTMRRSGAEFRTLVGTIRFVSRPSFIIGLESS